MTTATALDPFEGRPVVATKIILTRTGDGLSQAMEIAPLVLHHGQVVDLVVRSQVAKIRHDEDKGEGGDLIRVQILEAQALTVVDNAGVRKLLDKHLADLARQKEVDGQAALDDDEGEPGE
jgi:RecA/RadA recombinase